MNYLLRDKRFPDQLFTFGLITFSIGLSTSKVVLSISTIILALSLILDGNYSLKWDRLKQQPLLLPLFLYLFLHLIGLFWTSDFSFAMNDLKTKLTLLVVPLIIAVQSPSEKEIQFALRTFVLGIIITSLINIMAWHQWFGHRTYLDIRELSLFGSHIRYGILVALAAGICLYEMNDSSIFKRWILAGCCIWLLYYTYTSQIISGALAMITVLVCFIFWWIHSRSKAIAYLIPSSIFLFIIISGHSIWKPMNQMKAPTSDNLPEVTINGNPYTHNLEPGTFYYGQPVLAFLCEQELKKEWGKVSALSYDSLDKKGQPLRFTLMRYLTTLRVHKDSVGFQQLNQQDVLNIEHGITSRQEAQGGLLARWDGIRFQLQNTEDPNGHSLLQRLEYWKTAWQIIADNWLFGVGTGDLQKSFDAYYKKNESKLLPQYRLRAHNSYLTSWVSFGIAGIGCFIWLIILFLRKSIQKKDVLAFTFICVATVTFILEDTLETQVGASFFAFFYGLFCVDNASKKNY